MTYKKGYGRFSRFVSVVKETHVMIVQRYKNLQIVQNVQFRNKKKLESLEMGHLLKCYKNKTNPKTKYKIKVLSIIVCHESFKLTSEKFHIVRKSAVKQKKQKNK